MWYVYKDYILISPNLQESFNLALICGIHEKYAMWKFIVDIVHDFVSSLQPDGGRGFLHVSNVFLFRYADQRYHKTSDIRRTLVGNKIVDHSDVVGASPVGGY